MPTSCMHSQTLQKEKVMAREDIKIPMVKLQNMQGNFGHLILKDLHQVTNRQVYKLNYWTGASKMEKAWKLKLHLIYLNSDISLNNSSIIIRFSRDIEKQFPKNKRMS